MVEFVGVKNQLVDAEIIPPKSVDINQIFMDFFIYINYL